MTPLGATSGSRQAEQHGAYAAHYHAIGDPALQAELHRLAHDPRLPTGILRAWALAYARWRVGDLDRYPCPPSASIPGMTGERAIAAISDASRIIEELVPFRSGRLQRLAAAGREDELERVAPRPTSATARWSNER